MAASKSFIQAVSDEQGDEMVTLRHWSNKGAELGLFKSMNFPYFCLYTKSVGITCIEYVHESFMKDVTAKAEAIADFASAFETNV